MRIVKVEQIKETVKQAVRAANTQLPEDILDGLQKACAKETVPRARRLLEILLENAHLAQIENMPLCQDTGLVTIQIQLGQEVSLTGGDLYEAIDQGVREGYLEGYFRASMVKDPLERVNTGDNTPAVVHLEMTPGDQVVITVFPKGAGSENMGRTAMLKPADGWPGVRRFIIETVKIANANPCPPIIVGVGLGGNMEKACLLAKKALLRPINRSHADSRIADLEAQLLQDINQLGIGPQGLGGDTTALAVNMEVFPTHIASLPVAVSLNCHSTRRAVVTI
ncbi:MAG: fumarate hydratase [Syntrophomonadaceae bacterium]|jgi:fumarate hydratase subunit alpha|nr:fumarate hydratase [Bacillota bacterium]NLP23660.1 fumarate hydratase [Syntrophomonadaceae bacterium]